MPGIAYFANLFPSPVEPYVMDEITALRRRGIEVLPCSAWRPSACSDSALSEFSRQTLYLLPLGPHSIVQAVRLGWSDRQRLSGLLARTLSDRQESLWRRMKAGAHTFLAVQLAAELKQRGVEHIHVHHGYFASWMAMVAAQLLGITYSLTLHGSDLLLHGVFLEEKLRKCAAAFTVSEFNLRFLQDRYPECANKIRLRRLGTTLRTSRPRRTLDPDEPLVILTIGRLHAVKDHNFLLQSCTRLKTHGMKFLCLIAGDGPERKHLESKIRSLGLRSEVKLLGHVPHPQVDRLLSAADLFVLTSRSEGIPVALMEAMAEGIPVLAPDITGIPELVSDGSTGFLYPAGSLDSFVERVEFIRRSFNALTALCAAARRHLETHFNHDANLRRFIDDLLQILPSAKTHHEDPVLQ